MKASNLLVTALVTIVSTFAQAQSASTDHNPQASHVSPSATSMADGEVRKVDKAAGRLTLRHGPIENLDMPGMTMVFKAADPKLLDTLKEGDKVRFVADRVVGVYTVTHIEAAR